MTMSAFALPQGRYVPGQSARPAAGTFAQVVRHTPPVTTSATAQTNRAWLYGIDLINAGYYWEAHEVLEPVWLRARLNSRERALVQGMIQLANAALKVKMGRPAAALRLLDMARRHLHAAGGETVMALQVADAVRQAQAAAACIRHHAAVEFHFQPVGQTAPEKRADGEKSGCDAPAGRIPMPSAADVQREKSSRKTASTDDD